ncbi:putative GTP-binding protein EngB [Campylobacterota bacterium]|nr:putative GTP-binding protein EngB [Campylobacterota bacterium]
MKNIKVTKAEFLLSAANLSVAPSSSKSEVVFLGRSNVGKSSLLNALLGRKGLAKTSATPGKTRLINFYEVGLNDETDEFQLRFVDLPGFGYAKVSKVEQQKWERSLADFLRKRESIRLFIRLIDARHPSLEQDIVMQDFVHSILRADQKDIAVFTKSDKLSRKEKDALAREFPNALITSSSSQDGIDLLLSNIVEVCFATC